MAEIRALAAGFEEHRGPLLRVAYRLLGRLREAYDVVELALEQQRRDDAQRVDDPSERLLETVARACLATLRAQRARREPRGARLPDPQVSLLEVEDGERDLPKPHEVSLALLVVLATLSPAERLVYVLHDMCALPLEWVTTILERTPTAVRQLETRARRRVSGASRLLAPEQRAPRRTVQAFLVAARRGDFDALLAVLDPDVVLRADQGATPIGGHAELRGAGLVAKQTLTLSKLTERAQLVKVNGSPGVVTWLPGGQPFAVLGFTVLDGKLAELYVFADPARLARLDLTLLTRARTHPHD